ncbi:MAG: hypothetical protein V2B18_12390, partial [Pseudomonadota bacterium]
MEIEFGKPWTDEQRAYIKANLSAIGEATGSMFLDPSKPLTAAEAATLKIQYKVAGNDVEELLPEVLTKASKAEGAEARFRSAAAAVKFQEAHNRFVAATKEGKMPTDDDLVLVAGGLGVTKEQLAEGLGAAGAEDNDDNGDKNRGKKGTTGIDPASPEFQAAVERAVETKFGKRMFPTEYHQQYNNEGFQKQTEQMLRS